MVNIKNNAKKGFTIIEVVLVLAIAGLIFLMVFVAFPALQRNQKDSQRRQDYAMLSSAVSSYMANNNNSLTGLNDNKVKNPEDWINKNGTNPDGDKYVISVYESGKETLKDPDSTSVYIVKKAKCDGGTVVYDSSARAYVIYGYMESGDHIYCADSGNYAK